MNVAQYSDKKVFQYGDKITRGEFPLYAKQRVNEKLQRVLCNWQHSDEQLTDLSRVIANEMGELEAVCEYCLENLVITSGIEIVGKRIDWYQEPETLTWRHHKCEWCDRMVERTYKM